MKNPHAHSEHHYMTCDECNERRNAWAEEVLERAFGHKRYSGKFERVHQYVNQIFD